MAEHVECHVLCDFSLQKPYTERLKRVRRLFNEMPSNVKTCQFPVIMSGHKANPSHFKHLSLGQGLNLAVDLKGKKCGFHKAKILVVSSFIFSDVHSLNLFCYTNRNPNQDRPRDLVIKASHYKTWGPEFDSRFCRGNFPFQGNISTVTMVWVACKTEVQTPSPHCTLTHHITHIVGAKWPRSLGASNSEVGYSSVTTGRGDHKVYVDMRGWHWGELGGFAWGGGIGGIGGVSDGKQCNCNLSNLHCRWHLAWPIVQHKDERYINHRPCRTFLEVEQWYSSTLYLTSVLGVWQWSKPLYPGEGNCYSRVCGPFWKARNIPILGFDPRTVQSVASRYTDHWLSIPTELSRPSRPICHFSHYTTYNLHINSIYYIFMQSVLYCCYWLG
jgi:hypothetical protein